MFQVNFPNLPTVHRNFTFPLYDRQKKKLTFIKECQLPCGSPLWPCESSYNLHCCSRWVASLWLHCFQRPSIIKVMDGRPAIHTRSTASLVFNVGLSGPVTPQAGNRLWLILLTPVRLLHTSDPSKADRPALIPRHLQWRTGVLRRPRRRTLKC